MWCAPAPGESRPGDCGRLASFRRADLDRLEVLLQGSRYHLLTVARSPGPKSSRSRTRRSGSRTRLRRGREHAERVRDPHRGRDRDVGKGHPGGQHQAGMTRTRRWAGDAPPVGGSVKFKNLLQRLRPFAFSPIER
jgi:hypothetical protein